MLWAWGRNNNHLLRNNYKRTYSRPIKISINDKIKKLACGYDYMFLLNQQGQLILYFQSAFYQFNSLPILKDIATQNNKLIVITQSGQPFIWQFSNKKITSQPKLIPIQISEPIQKIFLNYGDAYLLSQQSSSLYYFQSNNNNKYKILIQKIKIKNNNNNQLIKWKQIALGIGLNIFLNSNGQLYYCNKNQPIQLINSNCKYKFKCISAAQSYSGITNQGILMFWNNLIQDPSPIFKTAKKFINVTLNIDNGYVITEEGQVWVWGNNSNGQLGLSDYQSRMTLYPMITMENIHIQQIIVGQGYTACIGHPKANIFHSINVLKMSLNTKNSRIEEIKQQSKLKVNQIHPPSPKKTTKSSSKTCNKENKTLIHRLSQKNSLESPNERKKEQKDRIKAYKAQNSYLKGLVKEKDEIIKDIKGKIRLLQEAIQDHQRTLTQRDQLMDKYQLREQQYEIHIKQLQQSIETLLKIKNHTTIELQKQSNINSYEIQNKNFPFLKEMLNKEEIQYKNKANQMNRMPMTSKSENLISNDTFNLKQDLNVENVIKKIKNNHSRISKSANKLLNMLIQSDEG